MTTDEYRTPSVKGTASLRERGSRFIGIALYVTTVEEAMIKLEEIRKEYYDATHHCFAYNIGLTGDLWRANDDGEPSGSAGKPILGQIRSAELTDIIVVVVRYYGGTKLGVPGLIKSYKEAAHLAIAEAGVNTRLNLVHFRVEFPYSVTSEVQRILSAEDAEISGEQYRESCSLVAGIRSSRADRFAEKFLLIEKVNITLVTDNG